MAPLQFVSFVRYRHFT